MEENNLEKPTFKKICLLHIQQLTNFPYIEKDFDALTDYGLLCKVVEKMNEVIENTNLQDDYIVDLYNAFVELKDYVDNLDLQEYVDKKLDEMAESGELEQIIESYLNVNSVLCFNTVDDMKNGNILKNGSTAKTLGYYSINDGGGTSYKVRHKTNDDIDDGGSIIFLDNNLVAELLVDENVNIKCFGCYGDDTHDDTLCLQKAIIFIENNEKCDTLYIPVGTYLVSHVEITKGINIIGENDYYSCIKSINNNTEDSIIELINTGSFHTYLTKFRIFGNKENNIDTIHGILCNINQVGLGDRYTQFSNLTISACTGYGIYLKHNVTSYDFRELRLDNILVSTCKKGIFAESTTDSVFTRITAHSNVEEGIYINGGNNRIVNCKCFWNGKGLDDTLEDIERIPASAFTITQDVTPQTGKTYYTRTGTGKQNYYYVYSEFTGDSFDEEETYYEMTTIYYKKYAGLVIKGERCIVDSCEFQDNFGDGIQVLKSNCSIQNVSCDNNGLITSGTTPVSYSSVGKNQLYFGVYINRQTKVIVTGAFNNFRYSSIGASQLAPIGVKTSSRISGDIVSNNNVYDDLYLISTDIKTVNTIINGKAFIYNVDMNNVTKGTDITIFEDTFNGSFIKVQNNTVYLNLILDDTNNAMLPTDSSDRNLATLPSNCRPPQLINTKAYLTGNHGYNLTTDVTVNISPNGTLTMKSSYNVSNQRKGLLLKAIYNL